MGRIIRLDYRERLERVRRCPYHPGFDARSLAEADRHFAGHSDAVRSLGRQQAMAVLEDLLLRPDVGP